jgi:hypothetical protein
LRAEENKNEGKAREREPPSNRRATVCTRYDVGRGGHTDACTTVRGLLRAAVHRAFETPLQFNL